MRVGWLGSAVGAASLGWAASHVTSPAVRGWVPGGGRSVSAGRPAVRVLGTGEPVVLLLHGMVAAGNTFGAGFDLLARHGTLVVPDLLGFGDSDALRSMSGAAEHLDALDGMLDGLGLAGRPLVIGAHSMGAVVALRFAARHPAAVRGVVTFGAPLWDGPSDARRRLAAMGRFEALLAGEGPFARAVCGWMCRHRLLASWIAAATRPDLPVAVARSGVKHTWRSYVGARRAFLRGEGWQGALDVLTAAGVPVTLTAGARDPVPSPSWCRDRIGPLLMDAPAGPRGRADLHEHP